MRDPVTIPGVLVERQVQPPLLASPLQSKRCLTCQTRMITTGCSLTSFEGTPGARTRLPLSSTSSIRSGSGVDATPAKGLLLFVLPRSEAWGVSGCVVGATGELDCHRIARDSRAGRAVRRRCGPAALALSRTVRACRATRSNHPGCRHCCDISLQERGSSGAVGLPLLRTSIKSIKGRKGTAAPWPLVDGISHQASLRKRLQPKNVRDDDDDVMSAAELGR